MLAVRVLHLPAVVMAESDPGHPSDWRRIGPMEDHPQGRVRGYVRLVALIRYRLSCVHSLALTVILLGFDNCRAGRMAVPGHRMRRPADAASWPDVRASAATVVRASGKKSGRPVVWRVPVGASRLLSVEHASLSR